MSETIEIVVPGAVWDDYLDPLSSGMEAELDLGARRRRRAGYGFQMIYEGASLESAYELAGYLADRAELLLNQDDDGMRQTHRRALKLAGSLYDRIADARAR
jgi:hypothetical protein